jgi:uncharacterized protein (DUF1330 family)
MPAYLLANIEITHPAEFEEYRAGVSAVIAAHGGRYLVRGGAVERLEGDAPAGRLVIVEFPDMTRLKAFYASADYQALLRLRQRAAKTSLLAIEGVSAPHGTG